jgi:uncharacterized damage-inducible protein DinB
MNKDLAEMFRYNAWANHVLFEACRSLTEEQLDMQIRGISGSVRELLMHIAGGQQTFVLRTKGRQHEGELGRQSDWPGLETVIQIAGSTSDELIAIAEQLKAMRKLVSLTRAKLTVTPSVSFWFMQWSTVLNTAPK